MGLITKEAKITLNAANVFHYETLGYDIPRYRRPNNKMCVKRGTTIIVKVEHLTKGSNAIVDVECDCCKNIINMKYCTYCIHNHDGEYYCQKCSNKLLHSGSKNRNYNPFLTDEERREKRNYPEYTEFVKNVMARDNYTCQCCNKNTTDDKIDIEVHHLYGYAKYKKYRLEQTQSITLCQNCHKAFHNWHVTKYGRNNKGNCTREQFEDWFGHALGDLKKYNGVLPSMRKVYDYENGKIYDSVNEYAKESKAKLVNIYNCCNHAEIKKRTFTKNGEERIYYSKVLTVKGHHLFWLDEYEQLSQEEINNYINAKNRNYKNNDSKNNNKKRLVSKNTNHKSHPKKVICLTTGEIFEQIKIAGEKYKLKSIYKIGENCSGYIKSAGKLSDGTKLHWMYYDDFIKLSQEEKNQILNKDNRKDGEVA